MGIETAGNAPASAAWTGGRETGPALAWACQSGPGERRLTRRVLTQTLANSRIEPRLCASMGRPAYVSFSHTKTNLLRLRRIEPFDPSVRCQPFRSKR